jgi:hypothetical protein
LPEKQNLGGRYGDPNTEITGKFYFSLIPIHFVHDESPARSLVFNIRLQFNCSTPSSVGFFCMTTTLDDKRRAVIKAFQPGDIIQIESQGAGAVLLRRMKPAELSRPKIIRLKKELFGKGGRRVTTEKVKRMLF